MAGDSNWSDVVLLMHFDGANSSTTFHDSSLSSHSFSQIFGSSISTAAPLYGTGALDGNSGNGQMYTSSSADFSFGSSPFTLEASVYPTSATARSIVMNNNFYGGGSDQYWAWNADPSTSSNNIVFHYTTDGSTGQTVTASFSLPLNTWTQLAVDYDGSTLRLYANGAVIGTGTLTGAIFAYASTGNFSTNDDGVDSNAYAGYLDEFRITKGVARYAGAYTAPSAAFPAYGSSPQPESGSGAGSGNVTNASLTYNLTTWEPNDILVVAVFNENHGTGNPATVASITSSGLTFAQRSIVSATNGGGMEVWWALAATPLIAQSMTIAFTGSFDDASSVAYGVAGCYTSSPWDSNGSLPATASGFSITGISTSQADDSLVSFVGSETGPGNPFGFTTLVSTSTFGGSLASAIITGYQNVSSTQSSISESAATGSFPAFIMDALTADASAINASPSITGVSAVGEADGVYTAIPNDPLWIATGTWFIDNGAQFGLPRIYTTGDPAVTYLQAAFVGDRLDVTVESSTGWSDVGIYASDNATLLYTLPATTTGGTNVTTTLTGFGNGSHTIFVKKLANDGLFMVLVSMAYGFYLPTPIVSNAIASVAATGAAGTTTPQYSETVSLTGASASGAAGNASLEIDANLFLAMGGVSATGSAGAPVDQIGVAAIGVSATGSAGSVFDVINISVVAVSHHGDAGSFSDEIDVAVTGVSATSTIGTIAHTLRLIPPLAAVSATGFAHPVNFESGSNLFIFADGVAATGTAGVATGGVSGGSLSASASGLAGTTSDEIDVPLTGASVTGAAASAVFEIDGNAIPLGASANGLAGNTNFAIDGTLFFWLGDVSAVGSAGVAANEIDVSSNDISVSASGSAGITKASVAYAPAGVSASGAAGSVTITAHSVPVVIGVFASGLAGLGAFLGSNADQISIHVSGASATGAAGTTTTSSFNNISGVNLLPVVAIGSAGNFTFAFGNSVTPVGVVATGLAGQITQAATITGVVGAGSVIAGNPVAVVDIGGITGQNVPSLTITTTATVPKGAVIVVAVSLNSTTLVLVSDGTNTYSTTSTTHGTGTVAQISWTAPLSAPLIAGSTITLTPLGFMSGAASAFYLTNVTTAAAISVGNASIVPTTTPTATDVNPHFANSYVVEVVASNGPFSDTFTQDPNGWSNFPVKRGTSSGGIGTNFYVAGGTQFWAYGILTYAPTITAEPWAIAGVGFTVDAQIITSEQVTLTGVAATGSVATVSGLAFNGVAGIGQVGTVVPTGAQTVEALVSGASAAGAAGAFAFIIDAVANGVVATGSAGILFPRAATTFFVVT